MTDYSLWTHILVERVEARWAKLDNSLVTRCCTGTGAHRSSLYVARTDVDDPDCAISELW